jgi:hypothetical protein
VSQLQLQDEVLDSHTSAAEIGPQWTELDHALLNDVDYDGDAYSKQLELMLAESGYFLTSNRKWLRSERNSLLRNTQLKDTFLLSVIISQNASLKEKKKQFSHL